MNQLISIVIPTFNSQRYIKEAIDSILNQSFTSWELIIVDGGSTDLTASIVSTFTDKRIKYFKANRYLNIVDATNKGIHASSGKYIGLLDSDNIMHPDRLKIQYLFLEQHKNIQMVGSWVQKIDSSSRLSYRIFKPYISDNLIKVKLLFGNCISQPSVMIRKSILQKYMYRPAYKEASDYDLWTRISNDYSIVNIPKVLTYYRVHDSNTSTQEHIKQNYVILDKKIIKNQFQQIKFDVTDSDIDFHYGLEKKETFSLKELKLYEEWLIKLNNFIKKNKRYDTQSFLFIIHCYWFRICSLTAKEGLRTYEFYNNSPLAKIDKNKFKMRSMLAVICLFRFNFAFDTFSYPWLQMNSKKTIKSYLRFILISLPIFIIGVVFRKILQISK